MSCDDWKDMKLGDICDIVMGQSPKGESCNNVGEGIPLLNGPTEFSEFYPKAIQFTNDVKKQCMEGDLLFCVRGSTTGRMNWADKEYAIGRGLAAIRHKSGTDYKYFVKALIDYKLNEILSCATGSTFPNVGKDLLNLLPINIPQIFEQKKISGILSSFDEKIELNNKINANLEQQAQAIFKSWFVDFEPFQDGEFVDSELGMIPEGWRVAKLSELCKSVSKTHDFKKEKLIFLNTGDIDKGIFLHKNYSLVKGMPGQAKKSINREDVLYSEIRPINSHYAYVDFESSDYVVSTKLMVIRSSGIDSRRLYQYLTSKSVINILQAEAESRSGTFPQIRFENIQNLSIILATNMVEEKYSRMIDSFYKKIDANVRENDKLSNLRDALLPKLMNGEVKILSHG